MRNRGFKKDGTKVEQRRKNRGRIEGKWKGAMRSVVRKEGNLSRESTVTGVVGFEISGLETSVRENSKGWKEKGQAEKEPVPESTHTVGNRREIVGGLGSKGKGNEWANGESGGRDNGEGAVGVRKLISIRSSRNRQETHRSQIHRI